MSLYTGSRISVGELIHDAMAEPAPPTLNVTDPLRWTATTAAQTCRDILNQNRPLSDCWRFGVLQTVDAYDWAIARGAADLASQIFDLPPPLTDNRNIDAALAALAEHLAGRDGWRPPAWVNDPERASANWYVAQAPTLEDWIKAQTPAPFAQRGVWISRNALTRA